MIRRLGITALAALGLGSCADLSMLEQFNAPFEGESRAPVGESHTVPNPADQAFFGGPRESEIPTRAAAAAAAPPMPMPMPMPRRKPSRAEPVALAEPDPDLLVGLDFEATKALLGNPALRMEQPPAKVWAYNGGSCMFSVFFYPSMGDSVFRVLTYEVTGKEPELSLQAASGSSEAGSAKVQDRTSPIVRRCFADLLSGRDVPNAG